MTPAERKLVDLLAETYNAFCGLPREHPTEVEEFAQSIHALQHLIASRPAWRQLASETIGNGVVKPRSLDAEEDARNRAIGERIGHEVDGG